MRRLQVFLATTLLVLFVSVFTNAQNVSINTDGSEPDASAMLDVKSTDKGMLIPRIDFNNVPTTPATGLLIYVTDNGPSGDSAFYYFNGDEWLRLATPSGGETDPVYSSSVASEITAADTSYWGGKLDIEVDGSTTNELQTLSISNDTIYLTDGSFVKLPAGFDGKYTSLTDVPANMDTDATDDFDGKYTSLTDVPANMDTDATDDFDGKYTSLTDVPSNMDTDATDDFDGKYTSLTDVPTNIDTDATDDVKLTGNQTIGGEKSFTDDATFSNITAANINATSSVTTTAFTLSTGATDGYVLKSDADGNASWQVSSSGADNLGNHTATETIKMGNYYLSNDGDSEGIYVEEDGDVVATNDFYVGRLFGGKLPVSTSDAYIRGDLYVGDVTKGSVADVEADINGKLIIRDSTSGQYASFTNITAVDSVNASIVSTTTFTMTENSGDGKVLISNSYGLAGWESLNSIQDMDSDTKIQLEESADEDRIRFDIGGIEAFTIEKTDSGYTRMAQYNSNSSIYIGENTGNLADGTDDFWGLDDIENIFIGKNAGRVGDGTFSYMNSKNVFIGVNAGYSNINGGRSIFIGADAGHDNTNGYGNIYIGDGAGYYNRTSEGNTVIGNQANYNSANQGAGVTIGNKNNTILGFQAGYKLGEGADGNIMIGYQAGYFEMGANNLYIDNSDTVSPLIYGKFDTDQLLFNADVTIDTNKTLIIPTNAGDGKVLTSDANGNASWEDASSGYEIGDFAQGGIIFWVDQTGQHGLVCAKDDQDGGSGIQWYNGSNTDTEAHGDGTFAGEMNTMLIIAKQGSDASTYAAGVCANYSIVQNGISYGDWYLPSMEELNLMYQNKATIEATAGANGGSSFVTAWYWTSTESSSSHAYMVSFYNGGQGPDQKWLSGIRVRAIRAF